MMEWLILRCDFALAALLFDLGAGAAGAGVGGREAVGRSNGDGCDSASAVVAK
jgi:hypothetical protein